MEKDGHHDDDDGDDGNDDDDDNVNRRRVVRVCRAAKEGREGSGAGWQRGRAGVWPPDRAQIRC